MKLYLVRHGRTEWNINKLIQGRIDVPLNEIGIKDAKRNSKKLKNIKFDVCYCSPLKRAKETADIIIDKKCDIIISDLITERDVGRLEGTTINSYKAKNFWDINNVNNDDGVETSIDLLARTKKFLDFLRKEYKEETILIVSHSGTIKAMHFNIVGYNKDTNFMDFYCRHDDIYEYDI